MLLVYVRYFQEMASQQSALVHNQQAGVSGQEERSKAQGGVVRREWGELYTAG